MEGIYTHHDAAGHYLQAEKLLSDVAAGRAEDPTLTVAAAQVHATLATAGTPSAVTVVAGSGEVSWAGWKERGESVGQWVAAAVSTLRSPRARRGAQE